MAKNKKTIDFIAAQKAISSAGHGPTFEIALVVTVIIVAAGMITWYVLTNKSYNTANDTYAELEMTLETKKSQVTKQQNKFNSYYVCNGKDGREYKVAGTNSDGTTRYETISITEIATEYATKVANAQSTSNDIKRVIDLTSTALNMLFESAELSGNTVKSFSFSNSTITMSLTTDSLTSMNNYYKYLKGDSSVPNYYGGCDVTDYFANVEQGTYSSTTEGSETVVSYSVTMVLSGEATIAG